MGLKIKSLDELDPDLVAQAQAELTQLMQERHPEVELSRGVLHDLVAYAAGGISGGVNQTEINRVLDSRSLLAISQNPLLADVELANHVFSNYRVTRKTGQVAAGELTIVMASDTTTVIASGAVFTANGQEFSATSAFTARPTGSTLQAPTDRILQPLGDGTFSFSISAAANSTGTAGNIRRATKLVPAAPPLGFVTAYATADFIGGSELELNSEVLQRLESGIAAKAWSNRTNIVALLKEQDDFADTLAYSIIGFGDAEMHRDHHWIWPTSGGGRTDLYARTQALPRAIAVRKTATLVDVTAAGGVWQISLGKDDIPGFYEVLQVIRPTDPVENSGFEVIYDQRGFDLTDPAGTPLPDVLTAEEAAYTRFQTAVIRFVDTATSTADLTVSSSQADYILTASAMPLLTELQTFCMQRATCNPAGDALAKAAVPCFLTLNFDIQQAPGETAPDLDGIKNELAILVNSLGFPGQLHASLIADSVHNHLTTRQALGALDMHGRIRRPNGSTAYIRSTSVLRIPDDPVNLVTGRTTVFLLDPSDIGISVITEGFNSG